MSIHKKLEQKYRWYKKWSNKPYAQTVHYMIFGLFAIYNLYLALELMRLTKMY